MKALLLVFVASTAYADDVTLDQAIALYHQHDARLVAAHAKLDVTAADLVDARIYPNPELGISTGGTLHGDTAGPDVQYGGELTIPLLVGRQRAHRERAARAHIEATRAEIAAGAADGELEVRARYADLVTAQDRTAVIAAALADARGVRDIVAGRTTAGAASSYAVERIDLAIASLASRVDEATADEAAAAGELAIAVGMPGWHPHATGTLELGAPLAPDPEHPALVADRANVAAARADLERARADATPIPSLGLQVFSTAVPSGVGASVGISLPLPLFDRNQGARERARAESRRAELELAAKQAELAGALDRATRVLAGRRDALAHFQADTALRLPKLRTMAEAAYRNGQSGIVELLDALDAITDARLRALELRAAVASAELALRTAARGR